MMEKADPLLNGLGGLLSKDTEKDEMLKSSLLMVFSGSTHLQKSEASETSGKVWSKKDLPFMDEDLVREYLNKLNK